MSFRKTKNTHDEWVAFRNETSDFFELFVDGDITFVNQKSFEEYLTKGSNQYFHTSVEQLTDLKFLLLEKIVKACDSFDFGFDAFYSERIKRFNRYG
jgi:hypothetical protein